MTARRRRRTPEESRAVILDAASAALEEAGPDQVSLRAVAARAHVSHALVTHYFGTHEALVSTVLARRREAALAAFLAKVPTFGEATLDRALDAILEFLMDPTRRRLRAWLDARGSVAERDARRSILVTFAKSHVDKLRAARDKPPIPIEAMSGAVAVVIAACQGYVPTTPTDERQFRDALKIMVESVLFR